MDKIGRYEIRGEIGRGGMAIVYRAYDPRMEREVALKFLPQRSIDIAHARERFRREATIVANLIHPGIVPVYDFDDRDDQNYLVMQYMAGGSLVSRLRNGPLQLTEILHILSRIGPALDYAHSKGLIHRDIKPANILFDHLGEPFLADFGIVKMMEDDQRLTMTGSILGTPAYMSPEQALGQEVGSQSDIYSLGVVLFQMLTGRLPYTADTPLVQANMHVIHPVPQLRAFNPSLPTFLQPVIDKAMAKTAEERYQTAKDLYSDLYYRAGWGDGQAVLEDRSGSKSKEGGRWSRWLLPLLLVFIGIILVSGLLYFFAREQRDEAANTAEPEANVVAAAPAVSTSTRDVALVELASATPISHSFQVQAAITVTPALATISATGTPTVTPTATLIPTRPPDDPALGSRWQRVQDDMIMVFVPAGEFVMGSTGVAVDQALSICLQSGGNCSSDLFDDEMPQHLVTMDAFWIDQTEVTNEQFALFLSSLGNQSEGSTSWYQLNEPDAMIEMSGDQFKAKQGFENHPVTLVTWYAAKSYCEWAGGHLPTEAQWEYAAKGPEGTIFPWGNNFKEGELNFCDLNCPAEWANRGVDDGFSQTSPVGLYASNVSWVGSADMAGNVWEWTNDWYGENYYLTTPFDNPLGPGDGSYKTLRGGSWNSPEHFVRTTARYSLARRSFADQSFGLRCVH